MSTLYIRHPARADGESAACGFALVLDNGSIAQRGDGPLANLGELVAASKRVMVEQQDWTLEEMFARQAEITGHLLASEDAREGATAFAEKRAPEWKGR